MLLSYVFLNIENRSGNVEFNKLNYTIGERVLEHMKDLENRREHSYARVVEGGPVKRERTISRRLQKSTEDDDRKPEEIQYKELTFFSGNPAVEITHGIIHLYKSNTTFLLEKEDDLDDKDGESTPLTDVDVIQSKTLLLYAIPFDFTFKDVLQFVFPFQDTIRHLQVLQTASATHYMCLANFSSTAAAKKFYYTMNKRQYSSLLPGETCHLFFVAKVDVSEGDPLINPDTTELPDCIVCLEKMDESVAGLNLVSTILCNHTIHGKCLKQWNVPRCPVCRYVQSPQVDGSVEETEESSFSLKKSNSVKCSKCGDGNLSQQELWICLVCGHLGCGRYTYEHAKDHFLETNHNYAMSLIDNKVWDYSSDMFVHRLLQTNNHKQVVIEEKSKDETDISKQMIALEMECMQLLSQQLDSQRQYWEDQLLKEKQKNIVFSEKSSVSKACQASISKKPEPTVKKDVYEKLKKSFEKTVRSLHEEKAMSKALSENYNTVKQESTMLKEKVRDLEDFTRDLQFHIQSQEKTIQEQIAGGSIAAVTPTKKSSKSRKK